MRLKKIFLLAPILASTMVLGCKTNNDVINGSKSRITVAFNAGDYTFKDNKSHIMPITISNGVDWTFLKKNLKENLIKGKKGYIDYPDNVTFNYWKLNGEEIDKITPVPKFTEDSITLEADYTVTFDVTLDVGDDHVIKDNTHTESLHSITYNVNKDSTYAELQSSSGFKIYKSDGTTLATDFNYFVDSTGVSIPKGSEENYKFVRNNEKLTAKFAGKEKTDSFVTDDWEVFCQAAEQGLEYVSSTNHGTSGSIETIGGYKEEYEATEFTLKGKTYTKAANTFIGLKKTVQIGDVEYPVTVIGQDQDYSGNQKCTFTFLFDNLISTNRSFGTQYSSNNYDSSPINTYLNNQFFYSLPLSLRDHLKNVDKYTNGGGGLDPNSHIVQGAEKTVGTDDKRHKLFIPSLAEMNFTQYKDGYHLYDASGTRVTNVEPEGLGAQHEYNSCYQGFSTATTKQRIKKPIIVDETTGEYTEGDPSSYWLRSPDLAVSHFTWAVNEKGDIDDVSTDVSKCRGVCPGFCVGAEKSSIVLTVDPNGGTWPQGTSGEDPITVRINNTTTTLGGACEQVVIENGTPTGPASKPNFLGWYKEGSGTTEIDPTTVIDSSTTVYAKYTNETIHTFKISNTKYSIKPTTFVHKSKNFTVELICNNYIDNDGNVVKVHTFPDPSELSIKNASQTFSSSDYYYNQSTGVITIKNGNRTTSDLTIDIKHAPINLDWKLVNEICKKDEDNQISKAEGEGVPGYIVKQYFDYGDTKTLTIDSKNYRVQVIDMAHAGDTFTSGTNTVTAGLTFDFVYVPYDSNTFSDAQKGNQRFDYYNANTPSNIYTKCTALYNSSTEIKNYVKTVNKNFMKDNGQWSKPVLSSLSCNFFIPSVIEYGFTNNFWDAFDDKNVLNDLQNKEGSAYYLYNNIYNTTRAEMKKYSINNTSTPISYWTRSCVYDYDGRNENLLQSQMYYSGSSSGLYGGKSWNKASGDTYKNAYYAPAFCI